MANTGPDGVNRCSFLRGKKCEQKRYEDSLNDKLNNELKAAEVKDATSGNSDPTIIIVVVAMVLLIGGVIYYRTRKK